jgi:hypothetical protein
MHFVIIGAFKNVSEFKSIFQEMRDNLGIKCIPTTYYSPLGISIIERLYTSSYGQCVKSL